MTEMEVLEKPQVQLVIPCRAEYIGVARLAIMSVASRMSFSYDRVEDIRLAVSEACNGAIERAKALGYEDGTLQIGCTMTPEYLRIRVEDDVASMGDGQPAQMPEPTEEQSISALLMEILMDEIRTDTDPQRGTRIEMTKYIEDTGAPANEDEPE